MIVVGVFDAVAVVGVEGREVIWIHRWGRSSRDRGVRAIRVTIRRFLRRATMARRSASLRSRGFERYPIVVEELRPRRVSNWQAINWQDRD